jgi:hypothetical protein
MSDPLNWRLAVIQCHGFKDILQLLDLDKLIEAGNSAGAIGPILDPTLYRDKGDAMECDLAVLKAARTFIGAIDEAIATAKRRAAR